jgi:hypothetical protein
MTETLFKILCASLASLALAGGVAATASAAEFHSEQTHTELAGEQHAGEDTVVFNAGTWKCNTVTYSGTQSAATTNTIEVAPFYSNCTAFGFVSVAIDVEGCKYLFATNAGTTEEGKFSIQCPAGKAITVTAFNCYIKTGTQGPLTTVTFTDKNTGASRDITLDLNLSGIVYSQESKSFPGCTGGNFSNGTWSGAATVVGHTTAGTQVGMWAS